MPHLITGQTSSRSPDRGSHCEIINAPYGVNTKGTCEATVVGVHTFHMSPVSSPCGILPVRGGISPTLNPSFSWSPDRERYRKSTLRRGHRGYIVFLLWREISANVFIPCRIPHKALISFAYGEMLMRDSRDRSNVTCAK